MISNGFEQGLGTSTDADARDYFSRMEKHMIPSAPAEEGDRELIDLAFFKKKADDRKEWLRGFKSGTYLDHNLALLRVHRQGVDSFLDGG